MEDTFYSYVIGTEALRIDCDKMTFASFRQTMKIPEHGRISFLNGRYIIEYVGDFFHDNSKQLISMWEYGVENEYRLGDFQTISEKVYQNYLEDKCCIKDK